MTGVLCDSLYDSLAMSNFMLWTFALISTIFVLNIFSAGILLDSNSVIRRFDRERWSGPWQRHSEERHFCQTCWDLWKHLKTLKEPNFGQGEWALDRTAEQLRLGPMPGEGATSTGREMSWVGPRVPCLVCRRSWRQAGWSNSSSRTTVGDGK